MNSCPNQWIVFCKNNIILQESQKTDAALFWADMQDSFFHIQNLCDYFSTFKSKEGPTREPQRPKLMWLLINTLPLNATRERQGPKTWQHWTYKNLFLDWECAYSTDIFVPISGSSLYFHRTNSNKLLKWNSVDFSPYYNELLSSNQ